VLGCKYLRGNKAMHPTARMLFALMAIMVSIASPAMETKPGAFELRWVCAPQQTGCERIEAIHSSDSSGPFFWVEKAPFFATSQPATWQECQRFGAPFLCVQFGKEDMERLSEFATPENRRRTGGLIFNGRVIASMGFIGPSNGPLYVGGPSGSMSTRDIAAFLQSTVR
jgi:hypothetical protein